MKWIRPSGTEFESNDLEVTIKYLESLGWEKVEKKEVKKPTVKKVAKTQKLDS